MELSLADVDGVDQELTYHIRYTIPAPEHKQIVTALWSIANHHLVIESALQLLRPPSSFPLFDVHPRDIADNLLRIIEPPVDDVKFIVYARRMTFPVLDHGPRELYHLPIVFVDVE